MRYPRLSLGRKNPKKDPELRGKADYILEVQHRIRWVIEAKPPGAVIRQQAGIEFSVRKDGEDTDGDQPPNPPTTVAPVERGWYVGGSSGGNDSRDRLARLN